MKIKLPVLFVSVICMLLSCSKSDGEGQTCEDTHNTTVTFTNTQSVPLRLIIADRSNPAFEPVDIIFTLDLAAGASEKKEFVASQYAMFWYKDCATTCDRISFNLKTFNECEETIESK